MHIQSDVTTIMTKSVILTPSEMNANKQLETLWTLKKKKKTSLSHERLDSYFNGYGSDLSLDHVPSFCITDTEHLYNIYGNDCL